MTSNIRKARSTLIALLMGIFILNAGLFYMGYKINTDSQPQKLEILKESIQNNEFEVSNEWYISKIDSMKSYALASDKLVGSYKIMIGTMALLNILIVLFVTTYLLRLITS